MLLFFNMNLELHSNVQIIYTYYVEEKHGVWYLASQTRGKPNGCKWKCAQRNQRLFVIVMIDSDCVREQARYWCNSLWKMCLLARYIREVIALLYLCCGALHF